MEALTSVTTGRSRKYATAVGPFSYRMIPLAAFRIGMDRVELDDGRSFLIATPEKALADKIRDDRGVPQRTIAKRHRASGCCPGSPGRGPGLPPKNKMSYIIVLGIIALFGPHLWARHVLNRYNRQEYFSGNGIDLARLALERLALDPDFKKVATPSIIIGFFLYM